MTQAFSHLGQAIPSHAAFQIRTGQMDNALFFFKEIGWNEINEAVVRGSWGQARFVSPNEDENFAVQLTELADDDPNKMEVTENHLAIHFSAASVGRAAGEIYSWAHRERLGEGASMEAANTAQSKWFVYLPAIFKFALEIV